MVRLHWEFEWDDEKAASNLRKHGVSFELAASVVEDLEGDRFHLDLEDPSHSDGEDRYLTTGSVPADRSFVLIICWTDRTDVEEQVTRVISARRASKREVKHYVESIGA